MHEEEILDSHDVQVPQHKSRIVDYLLSPLDTNLQVDSKEVGSCKINPPRPAHIGRSNTSILEEGRGGNAFDGLFFSLPAALGVLTHCYLHQGWF